MAEKSLEEKLWDRSVSYCYDVFYEEEGLKEEYEKILDMPIGEQQAEAKLKFWEDFKAVVRGHISVDAETDERVAIIIGMEYNPLFDLLFIFHDTQKKVEDDINYQRELHSKELKMLYPECFERQREEKDEKVRLLEYMLEYVKDDFESEADYATTHELLLLAMKKDFKSGSNYTIPKQENIRRITYIIFRIAREKLLFGGRYKRETLLVPFLKEYFVNYKSDTVDFINSHLSDGPLEMKKDFEQYFSDFFK